MPEDAPPNGGAPALAPAGSWTRVAGMQAKLHRWAVADPGRRFDDVFNFVHDPATLIVAFARVAGNQGANTPGVDGVDRRVGRGAIGVPGFPGRPAGRPQGRLVPASAGAGTQDPQAGRVGKAPQARNTTHRGPGCAGGAETGAGAHLRGRLPAGLLRVSAQAAAQDAIAEIHHFGTRGYRWVLDADIEAAFDYRLALRRHGRGCAARIKDKRVLALVKAFLKAGVLTELGEDQRHRDRHAARRHLVPADLQRGHDRAR